MTTQETFRIYPTQESFKAQSSDWTEITGEIHFDKSALITSDGTKFRLNLTKYSLNDPWEDIDYIHSGSKFAWFIPLDDRKWRLATVEDKTYFGFKEDNQWHFNTKGNATNQPEFFDNRDLKRTYRRCLKIIRKDGVDISIIRFPWETNKSIIEQIGPTKVRHTKITKSQDEMPTAFVDDANQEEVIGYIYPVI